MAEGNAGLRDASAGTEATAGTGRPRQAPGGHGRHREATARPQSLGAGFSLPEASHLFAMDPAQRVTPNHPRELIRACDGARLPRPPPPAAYRAPSCHPGCPESRVPCKAKTQSAVLTRTHRARYELTHLPKRTAPPRGLEAASPHGPLSAAAGAAGPLGTPARPAYPGAAAPGPGPGWTSVRLSFAVVPAPCDPQKAEDPAARSQHPAERRVAGTAAPGAGTGGCLSGAVPFGRAQDSSAGPCSPSAPLSQTVPLSPRPPLRQGRICGSGLGQRPLRQLDCAPDCVRAVPETGS
ncbi:unnamed protein product [Coccothraustes coccothraustes]